MSARPAYLQIAEKIKTEWLSNGESVSGKKLPTQEEFAARFQVSRSTVVRALSKLVAEGYLHTQQGSGVYIADPTTRSANVNCISLIVPDLRAYVIIQACRGVERRARQLGYKVLLASSEGNLAHEQELVMQHTQAGAKGIVLYPVTRYQKQLSADYLANGTHTAPIVAMDIGCEEWPCTRVHFDNYRLAYEMTQLLQKHGHRHIAFMHIATDNLHLSIHDRAKGWEAAMDEAGLLIPPGYHDWPLPMRDYLPLTDDDYEAIARDMLCLEPRPDALIAWNDVAAAHLTQALLNLGVRVPEDIRITGFDNEPMITRLFRPLFPTSRPDFARMGELAIDALAGMLKGEWNTPRIYYYPVPILWREPRPDILADAIVLSRGEPNAHANIPSVNAS